MPKLPSGLKTFEASDTVRRIAQNENIEATDALFHDTKGHRHTGKAGDAPQIGREGIASLAVSTEKIADGAVTSVKLADGAISSAKVAKGSLDRSHLRQSGGSANIAKYKKVTVTEGSLYGNPTTPFTFQYGSAGDNHYWSIMSGTTLPQSMTIDLKKEYIRLEGMSFGSWVGGDMTRTPRGFFVETSRDGITWSRVYTHNGSLYEPFSYLAFTEITSGRYVRLTVTTGSGSTDTVISCVAVYSSFHGNVDLDALEDERTWGLNARMQGLMIIPEGKVTDNGSGVLTLSGAITIMNPASGTYFRVKSGTYSLGTWGYLYVDIPHTYGTLVDPYVAIWNGNGPRNYDYKDRIILAQRNSGSEIYFHASLNTRLMGATPDADKVDGIDFQTKNGYLEYNDGSGWKGVGMKSVQRGTTDILWEDRVQETKKSVTINAVNKDKSFINVFSTGYTINGTSYYNTQVKGRLVTGTQLEFEMQGTYVTRAYMNISWEVVEFV